ncbi:Mitoguardin 2 [Bienertia sinuspersici]
MEAIQGKGEARNRGIEEDAMSREGGLRRMGEDKATRDASESFMGAIEDVDQQIQNHPLNVESESDDDIEDKRPTHSKKEKVKDVKEDKVKGKNLKSLYKNNDDELVAFLHGVSNNFVKIFENINDNLETIASAWSKAEEKE